MPKVKGPNGRVYDMPEVVASGLVGSPSGDYEYVKTEPRKAPEKKSTTEKPARKG